MDHKHASFQTVINSSSQRYTKLSTLIWFNFIALKWFCDEYWLEQHEITFVESKSFRAENKTVGVQTCDDHINNKTEHNQDFCWKSWPSNDNMYYPSGLSSMVLS